MTEPNKNNCHCGDDIADLFKDEIRRNVCKNLTNLSEYQGKEYCVLHYPGKAKEESFERVLRERLKRQDYNFEGVWFPDNLDLSNIEFDSDVNFRNATFAGEALFNAVLFKTSANFASTKFLKNVSFRLARFSGRIYFDSAEFLADVSFAEALFFETGSFTEAKFLADVSFNKTVFLNEAYFSRVNFLRNVDFSYTEFSTHTSFLAANFSGKVKFLNTSTAKEIDFSLTAFLIGSEPEVIKDDSKAKSIIYNTTTKKKEFVKLPKLNLSPKAFNKHDFKKKMKDSSKSTTKRTLLLLLLSSLPIIPIVFYDVILRPGFYSISSFPLEFWQSVFFVWLVIVSIFILYFLFSGFKLISKGKRLDYILEDESNKVN